MVCAQMSNSEQSPARALFFPRLAGTDASERTEGGEKENEVICGRIDRQVGPIDQ